MGEYLKRLRELRLQKGIYQKEIADYLGITVASYSLYENGSREPNIYILKRLAKYYNVSLDYLMGRDNTEIDDNGQVYYINEETAEMADKIFHNKELRLLFDAARDAQPEDLEAVHHMLLALKRKERHTVE